MPPTTEDLPRLGRYQVINKIAAGGMAEVFLAKAVGAMGFQRLVALKLIHSNFTRDDEFVKMFIDEARIAMHLHHRNIVQVFDLDKADDTYFIAMEFVHGVNLYDVYERIASKNRWIDPAMALYLVAEVSKGLHFAHTRKGQDGRPLGIVHRDISPQNVLLSFEGEVKITDFGIATAAERLHQTAAGIVKGKYAYMAPERLQEKPTDGRVDVFSAGVLLYELLVGENPFAGTTAVDTIENVLNKRVPPPSARGAPVSAPLDRITLKALAKDPNERYATAQELADELTGYALELTHTRREMAAGDGALASLLNELFPEKAKRPPVAAEPKSLNLPGLRSGTEAAQETRNGRPTHDAVRAEEPGPSDGARAARESGGRNVAPRLVVAAEGDNAATSDDLDEPTVLRLAPVSKPNGAPLPSVASVPEAREDSRSDGDYTTREVAGLVDDPAATLRPDGPPFHVPGLGSPQPKDSGAHQRDTDESLSAVQDPSATADAIDQTAPTTLPPSGPPPQQRPSVAARPMGAVRSPEPLPRADSLPSTSNAATLQGQMSPALAPAPLAPSPSEAPSPRAHPTPTFGMTGSRGQPAPHVPAGVQLPPPGGGAYPSPYGQHPGQMYPGAPHGHPWPVPRGPGGHPHGPPQTASYAPGAGGGASRLTTFLAIFLFIIAAGVLVATGLVLRRNRSEVIVSPTRPVHLRVTSEPPGARIILDGQEQNGSTPLEVPVVPNEEHRVLVRLAAYADPPEKTVLPPESPKTYDVHFDLVPLRGTLEVQVTPPEAVIFINDQAQGPARVSLNNLVLPSEISVRAEARGHVTQERSVVVDAGHREQRLKIELVKGRSTPTASPHSMSRMRRVYLRRDGSWVGVYLNGRYIGTTPAEVKLPVGEVTLRILNDSESIDRNVTIMVPETGSDPVVPISLPYR